MELGTWELTEQFVHDYLSAVGDGLPVYARHGLVPPVALAARALGYLLEQLDLPRCSEGGHSRYLKMHEKRI